MKCIKSLDLLTRGMFSGNNTLSSWRTLEIAITDPPLSLSVPAVPCDMIETTSSDSPLHTNSLIAALLISVKKSLESFHSFILVWNPAFIRQSFMVLASNSAHCLSSVLYRTSAYLFTWDCIYDIMYRSLWSNSYVMSSVSTECVAISSSSRCDLSKSIMSYVEIFWAQKLT